MPDQPTIDIFAQGPALCAYLADIARVAGFEGRIATIKPPADKHPVLTAGAEGVSIVHSEGVRVLKIPVRAGEVIDALHRIASGIGALPAKLEIAGNIIDTRENLWLHAGENAIRLTEKEVAILCLLKESAPSMVTRQVLLDKVWAYAQGVETHTLETHIYRLRQKIEADPSKPGILLTAEDGYKLGG